jgi:pyruvate ferredoxin oxidoreductase gamma subunit
MSAYAGCVSEGKVFSVDDAKAPDWIDLPLDEADAAAAAIHAGATSVEVRTGLWRVLRPVIDYERCNRCWWVCSEFCPDSAIRVGADGRPEIDYDHCKGCMVCVAQCPPHAISAVPEREFAK